MPTWRLLRVTTLFVYICPQIIRNKCVYNLKGREQERTNLVPAFLDCPPAPNILVNEPGDDCLK